MGDPSIWNGEDLWLNCSVQQFLTKYLAFYKLCDKMFSDDTKKTMEQYYNMLNNKNKKKVTEYVPLFYLQGIKKNIKISNFEDLIVMEDGQVSLEKLDEQKIHGYWYDSFNYWLGILWCCGLRGNVDFVFSANDEVFSINFEDEEVILCFPNSSSGFEESHFISLLAPNIVNNLINLKEAIENEKDMG